VTDLEVPKRLRPLLEQAHAIAVNVFRPISRKYDLAEHVYPKELDLLSAIIDGANAGGAGASAILGSPEIETDKSFAGAMKTFDNTRPVVAATACGVARAALERTREVLGLGRDDSRSPWLGTHVEAELVRMGAELDAARLFTLNAAWMADNRIPNSLQASMAKAKAGRTVTEITSRCVELCGAAGYAETDLLEKWARDAKILDIFEGTQQIQMLVVTRRVLGKSSAELR